MGSLQQRIWVFSDLFPLLREFAPKWSRPFWYMFGPQPEKVGHHCYTILLGYSLFGLKFLAQNFPHQWEFSVFELPLPHQQVEHCNPTVWAVHPLIYWVILKHTSFSWSTLYTFLYMIFILKFLLKRSSPGAYSYTFHWWCACTLCHLSLDSFGQRCQLGAVPVPWVSSCLQSRG